MNYFPKTFFMLATLTISQSQQVSNSYCNRQLCPHGGPHIACNGLTRPAASCGPDARETPMDEAKRSLIVDRHNRLRSKVATGRQSYGSGALYPEASRMATLQWDAELACIAAANARRCVFGHDKCRNTVSFPYAGQNIAQRSYQGVAITDEALIEQFINDWFSEADVASPSLIARYPSRYSGPDIGHFTQIVSDRTTRVGCSLVSYRQGRWNVQYFVCNYAFTNMINQPVFVSGKACSRCTTGCNAEYPGLCSTQEAISARP
ncbi:antigen 5 like allergen Cul n 1-like [Culex pipiens pallens]|uniref:antigen 5 like allergen Cul n 1-like n=1 Tax=Culex pipiens pallens TaxID=42434 RepID=UPI001952F290|nr:antigen 5 like allergen Cul n 1-like [Culex pipiens pallens]